ncbi:MAG: trypsin-like peptidase domain-containing protein [Clostridia bacterium]|nr:trypsin-like peptidase domain-containing protein [Clostridia bacterium]
MKSLAKKILTVAVAAACAVSMCLLGACSSSHDEEDPAITGGNDTETENQTVINNTVTNNYYNITLSDDQFQSYLDYLSENGVGEATALEAASARSVFSSVSILCFLAYKTSYSSGYGPMRQTVTEYSDSALQGSGVIVDLDKENGDAYVLTNCHVIFDDTAVVPVSDRVYLYLYGQDTEDENYTLAVDTTTYGDTGNTYYQYVVEEDESYRIEATVVAASVQYDLALLKVSDSDVLKNSSAVAADFADDDEVYIGQSVYAVGNPLGAGTSVTTGVVSKDSEDTMLNVDSSSYDLYREIRTDAVVNPGNSGGGLYNSDGKIIGIVNAGLTSYNSETVEGTSYALCGSYVKRMYELMKDSSDGSQITFPGVSRAYLEGGYYLDSTSYPLYGYSIQNSIDTGYDTIYSYAYLDTSGSVPRARIVEEVAATTDSYGLEVGDIITHLKITDADGNTIEDLDITRKYILDDALISYRDGYTVTLTYVDGDNDPATINVDIDMISLA